MSFIFFAEEVTRADKCDVYTRFFDDNNLGARIDREFIITYKSIYYLPISTLMDQVKTNYVILNLYYVIGNYKENHFLKTENIGEIFFEVANNSFGLYIIVYLQIYFRIFFNLLKPVTKSGCKKIITKLKNNNNTLFACYSDTETKLLRYLNIILNNSAFEQISFTYRSGIAYIDDSFKISNLK